MRQTLYAGFIGLITGIIGTLSGCIIVFLVREIKASFLSFILGVSAGIMTVVVFLDLIPEALELGSLNTTLLGLFLGVAIMYLLDLIFPHVHFMEENGGEYYKAGLLLAIGIALHNIPEGLAIGAGYSVASSLGFGLAVIIGIQNFPEGMAVATSLSLAGLKNFKVALIALLAGLPMGLGAFLGSYFGSISNYFLSLSLGFAAGAMLFITFDDLLPAAHNETGNNTGIMGIIAGVFLGVYLNGIL
ncbi:MAG TPA: ZIP family metal transporter [Halanaerobiales bacterium]|nr:ZIP family metal transporter [Halanaerobiales bacterium]